MLARILRRNPGGDPNASAVRKHRMRQKLSARIYNGLPWIRLLLFLIGYTWLLLLPSQYLGTAEWRVDENALQPGQTATQYNWAEVHAADRYLDRVEELYHRNASSSERADAIKFMFLEQGIPAATQSYTFTSGLRPSHGVNTYAVLSAPRSSGTEAMVIAASWESLNGSPNLRGISFILSLTGFVKKYSLWSKDVVFVISDGHMEGMQAWLGAYHGKFQSNVDYEPLNLRSGVIWTALAIDYPGHSFSHMGIFYEGLNGRLPNEDLLRSFNIISNHVAGAPVVVYDHLDEHIGSFIPSWIPDSIRNKPETRDYAIRARNILRHLKYQTLGRASGIHGLFHQFRIDSITIFAVPATGPHGFHSLGRIVESTMRTMNNLLERLHASFFFFIWKDPNNVLKIGEFLPSAVLVGVALMFGGLRLWVDAGWVEVADISSEKSNDSGSKSTSWKTRVRNVIPPLAIMVTTHVLGAVAFWLANSKWWIQLPTTATSYLPILPFSLITFGCLSALLAFDPLNRPKRNLQISPSPLYLLLKSFTLCLTSTVISVTSVLNFSLAAFIAVTLAIPLSIATPTKSLTFKMVKVMAYHIVLLPLWWILFFRPMSQSILEWQVLGVWYAPFMCIVYLPLVLQAMVVCMLDPEFVYA
ncbi:hypothetical protein M422DRAFT_68279 [Sphaerobolus stellatus SS14]|uniref:Gaa1-domain-containing protein n=1 Tax=Sphaerobolus stellatus (strain SS14) TaxID=990650 RepID=A0A0C9VS43_SPHS4|nr:hypothetical protein M422DRAFT_68279 [Sphaerobolus stellatus SS14]